MGKWYMPKTPEGIKSMEHHASNVVEMLNSTYEHRDILTRSELLAAIRATCRINEAEALPVLEHLENIGELESHGPATYLIVHGLGY